MSAPTPATGDGSPTPGYYPDPSIPGYVRYWNGAAWVPGTSRPAPNAGEAMDPGPGQAAPEQTPAARVEETGPHFFDEEPSDQPSRPEPATAWAADTSRQTGFGGDRDNRVSWGGPQDPRTPAAHGGPAAGAPADPRLPSQAGDPTGGALPGVRSLGGDDAGESRTDNTAAIRAMRSRQGAAADGGTADPSAPQGPQAQPPVDHTVTIRALRAAAAAAGRTDEGLSVRSMTPGASAPAQPQTPQTPDVPQQQAPERAGHAPMTDGPGGGSASWAQQVHRLARETDNDPPVTPWKPPVNDPFLAAAQAQASARPASLGKRFAARLIDTVLLGAVVGAVAVPVGSQALAHINDKIDAAKQSGETVTVWLIDGTTSVHLAIILGALLVFGVLYEALPTAKWGRTLGKKVCGLSVMDIESHDPPSFGAALRRWLVYGVLGVIAVGIVNVLWCLFDRPWRQCWHDKAAHTFVTG
ncbi:RDD family protein [Streptomyces sp. AM8-1-1]|uniref:RDD family protein n=1 Tax=Streptomyces sp. AM8-1-1 TaxID=3075825 RepID=UPI0028C4144D|nr:RDD family protein [Streptomyces sp. AM8-1-1]WNO74338.1 RDD family protein [Streptomyces sp. AM8-1-1]